MQPERILDVGDRRRQPPPPPARAPQDRPDPDGSSAPSGNGEEAPARLSRPTSLRADGPGLRGRQPEGRGRQDDHRGQPRRLRRRRAAPRPCWSTSTRSATRRSALGGDRDLHPSSYDCLIGDVSVAEAARPAGPDNLWLVPASRDLAGASVELPRLEGSETRLRERLGPVRERFAFTMLDCPPSLGPVSVNALVAADRVIVPVQAEYLALEGLVQFLDTLGMIRRELNPALNVSGLLITMHDERTRLAQDVERELREHFPEMVFETVIPRSVRVAEAPSYGLPVTEHAPVLARLGAPTARWPRS